MTENETQKNQLHSNLERMAPKYCTSIGVTLLNNSNIVLTMVYNEAQANTESVNKSGANAFLIERVVIDLDHASKLAEILQSAVQTGKEQKKS